jgi:hypothetical protein
MNKLAFATLMLKYTAGAVMLGMLFALSWVGKFPVETLGTLLVGAFTALCGHAAGLCSVSTDGPPKL